MNKTKIEWADYTWNPVTGCLRGCEYCYARRIARRFAGGCANANGTPHMPGVDSKFAVLENKQLIATLDNPIYKPATDERKLMLAPYPYGFYPTLHRYRLGEPAQIKNPQNVFVCSMADLFGDWVPDEWIREVFKACEKAPQHRYLFLTKNPYKTSRCNNIFGGNKNWWVGMSVTKQEDIYGLPGMTIDANRFISIEPVLEPIDIEERLVKTRIPFADWVIIGAETGNRKNKVIPRREWIDDIVAACDAAGVPVFMKDSLVPIMGEENMRREFPWEVAK